MIEWGQDCQRDLARGLGFGGATRKRARCTSAECPSPSPLGARAAPHASRPARGRQPSRMPVSVSLSSRCARSVARSRRARGRQPSRMPVSVSLSSPLGCARSVARSRRARGRQPSRIPGTETSEKSWKNRSRSANKMADLREPTERARAFQGLQRGRPSANVRASANESLPPRAAGAARQSARAPQRPSASARFTMRGVRKITNSPRVSLARRRWNKIPSSGISPKNGTWSRFRPVFLVKIPPMTAV